MKNIIILGPQGSGKGTQADILSKKFNIPHISTGKIFRGQIKNKTELGRKLKSLVNHGRLVPNEITNEIIKNRLSENDCQNGFILDGFPRNLNQAEFLDKITDINLVLEIWISDEETISRISQRKSCPKCGAIYHLKFKPPQKDEICDKCQKKLIIRDDDKEKAIKKRLKIYHKQTELLIEFYKNKGIYHKINGMPLIPEVTKEIMKIFK